MLKRYSRDFTRVVYGYATVYAKSLKAAKELFDEGMFDEFDNNSDYEWTSEIKRD